MKITEDNIYEEANKGNLEVLESPLAVVRLRTRCTPLHSMCDSLRNCPEKIIEILKHPMIDKVEDFLGWTPLHVLASRRKITKKHIKEKYPWYNFRKDDIIGHQVRTRAVHRLLNTPNSVRFINEDH